MTMWYKPPPRPKVEQSKFDAADYDPNLGVQPRTGFLDMAKIDPRKYPRPDFVTPEQYEAGCDPDKALAEMPLEDMLTLWYARRNYLDLHRKGWRRRSGFEALARLIFPKSEERPFLYLFIWHYRDRIPIMELARRLGECRKKGHNPMSVNTVNHWMTYTRRQVERFWQAQKLSQKILDSVILMDKEIKAIREEELENRDEDPSVSI